MDDFKKWMEASNNLFSDKKETEQLDEIAPLVAAAGRAAVGSAVSNALGGNDSITSSIAGGIASGLTSSLANTAIDSFSSDDSELEEKVDDGLDDEFSDVNHVGASMDVSDLLSNIQYYQDNGLSLVPQMYDIDKLMTAPVERVKSIYKKVTGDNI